MVRGLVAILVFAFTMIPSTTYAVNKVGIMSKRTYATDGGHDAIMQMFGFLQEKGAVNYKQYFIEDFGATETARLDSIVTSTFLEDENISVLVWVGGSHNDADGASNTWAPDITRASNSYDPTIPMIWITTSHLMYYPATGSTAIRTGAEGYTAVFSAEQYVGGAAEGGIWQKLGRGQTLNTQNASLGVNTDVIVYIEESVGAVADSSNMIMWRTDLDAGWTYICAHSANSLEVNARGSMGYAMAEGWIHGYMLMAEIIRIDPTLWRREIPLYFSIEFDDEFAGTATSDGVTYKTAASTLDWYDTVSLSALADTLSQLGDFIVNIGASAESCQTTEALSKIPIYDNDSYKDYFYITWHDHHNELQKKTTVSEMQTETVAEYAALESAFSNRNMETMWSTGGQMGANFYTVMTPDSVMTAMLPAGVIIHRATVMTCANNIDPDGNGTPNITPTDPRMNSWLRKKISGTWVYWYPWGTQFTTSLTRNPAEFTDCWNFMTNHQNDSYTMIGHMGSLSYEQIAIRHIKNMRWFKNKLNEISGITMVDFGKPRDIVKNYYYIPKKRRDF